MAEGRPTIIKLEVAVVVVVTVVSSSAEISLSLMRASMQIGASDGRGDG